MKEIIFRSIVIISFITCVICSILFSLVYYFNSEESLRSNMHDNFNYIKLGYLQKNMSFLDELQELINSKVKITENFNDEKRVTLISPSGEVIFDTHVNPKLLDNHSLRPEFVLAKEKGVAEVFRSSMSLDDRTYYYAEKLPDGNILRLSANLDSFFYTFILIISEIIGIMLAIIFVIFLFSRYITLKIISPFDSLSLLSSDSHMPYKEIKPFLKKIRDQKKLIKSQITTLQRQETEFKIIFENMTEGLMLVDNEGNIKVKSLICDRFLRLLGLLDDSESLDLNSDHPAIKCLFETLKKGINTSVIVEKNEKFLNFLINPIILSGASTDGAIVVIIDVTEAASREQLRREFSANVSHELKTPLTSISGFAEIIRNGIAKPEDIKHFADNIYCESQRLLTLIADIIHLSALDENNNKLMETTDVDLVELTQNIMYYLKNSQEQKYVKVFYEKVDSSVVINCVRRIMEDALYNLCDNAIKYNRLGGKITFNIYKTESDNVIWQISDTGIGIPYESQDRIFERFFRVDKSHSREIGGTGLGLSIVKHVIAIHGGTIDLNSTEGQGSTFTLTLPLKMQKSKFKLDKNVL